MMRHAELCLIPCVWLSAEQQNFTCKSQQNRQMRMLYMSAGSRQDAADGGVPVIPEERAGRARAVPGRCAAVRAQQLVRCQVSLCHHEMPQPSRRSRGLLLHCSHVED